MSFIERWSGMCRDLPIHSLFRNPKRGYRESRSTYFEGYCVRSLLFHAHSQLCWSWIRFNKIKKKRKINAFVRIHHIWILDRYPLLVPHSVYWDCCVAQKVIYVRTRLQHSKKLMHFHNTHIVALMLTFVLPLNQVWITEQFPYCRWYSVESFCII